MAAYNLPLQSCNRVHLQGLRKSTTTGRNLVRMNDTWSQMMTKFPGGAQGDFTYFTLF